MNRLDAMVTMIDECHKARSYSMFQLLSKVMIRKWRAKGEEQYANWFETQYLDDKWDGWWVCAPPTLGVNVENQPLESCNRQLKGPTQIFEKMPMDRFFSTGVPRVFKYIRTLHDRTLTYKTHDLHQLELLKTKPIPKFILEKAQLMVSSNVDRLYIPELQSFFVNAKSHLNICMTEDRARDYIHLKTIESINDEDEECNMH